MTSSNDEKKAPDLRQGVPAADLRDGGMIAGRAGDDDVLVARVGDELFAIGASCTHYHGALADGLLVGDTVRCPLHHACFSLRTGDALRAPALDAVSCYEVTRRGDLVIVGAKRPAPARPAAAPTAPASVVIVGGGGAGLAAADLLRRDGYDGPIAMISADDSPPCDRPNLSKEYLSGEAQEDWIPLKPPEYYQERRIELVLDTRVTSIDPGARRVQLQNGGSRTFGALLLATGAEPVRLPVPGADGPGVHYLRSFADSRAIVAKAGGGARRAVVIGASFIGLEVAASLRIRGLEVDVVAPEARPLERTLGPDLGRLVQDIHEAHRVVFHLGETVTRIDGQSVTLSGGRVLEADLVVVGVGVRPLVALAEKAGLAVDHGILVNEYLETSAPGIFAAGDAARWLDRRSGERRRVEHWVVAERQGQAAAKNMLGRREPYDDVPFFWSQHFDVTIRYVGHSETWDAAEIDGSLADRNCTVTYRRGGRRLAVATISRDRDSLRAEVELEKATGG